MPIRVIIDRAVCDGFGNCVHAAADIFALDDDGLATAQPGTIGPERLEAIRKAIYDCPTSAISIVEE